MHIGIDLGGTKTESIIIDQDGKEIERLRKDTPKNYNGTLDTVCELVDYLENKYEKNCSVGIGSPGALSKETNCIKGGNSTWLNDRPLKKDIELRLNRKIFLENDANCFALSEAVDGAGKGHPVVFGVIIGTGIGGIQTLENEHGVYLQRGQRRVSPFFVPRFIPNIASGNLAIRFGLKGPNHTIISACASGTDAIGCAARTIQYGDADVMITGGSEASITGLTISGFANIKALSTKNDSPESASRPFDLERDGFVLGEGAAALVLEDEEHAKKRNATILGELAGYGATDDAYHITQPSEGGRGAIKAMKLAIKDANISPDDVDYINAHGTSTPFNDKTESAAISTLFNDHASKLRVSSTKSMIGHALGASGALEAVACVKAINENIAPPTINYENKDPDCTLNYVPNKAENIQIDTAMSNSFGFGGHNAVIVFKKWDNN